MTAFDPNRIRHQARLIGLEYFSLDDRWIELRLRPGNPICVATIELSRHLGAATVRVGIGHIHVWSEDDLWSAVIEDLNRLKQQLTDVLARGRGTGG